MKTCNKCIKEQPLNSFTKDRTKSDGLQTICKSCRSKYHKQYYKENTCKLKDYQVEYRRTFDGKIEMTYHNMQERVKGLTERNQGYQALDLIDKQEFLTWSYTNPDYIRLHEAWKETNFPQQLTPSIDRIDPTKGYTIGNMRWITNIENLLRSNAKRRRV